MASGVWRARVTKVSAAGVHVRVARLNRKHDYGPLPMLETLDTLAGAATGTGGTTEPHTHATVNPAVPALAVGDPVLVAFVEGRPDDLIVLGRIR